MVCSPRPRHCASPHFTGGALKGLTAKGHKHSKWKTNGLNAILRPEAKDILRLIHVNVWQKPLQYCKIISLQ